MITEHVEDGIGAESWSAVDRLVQETVQSHRRVRPILDAGPRASNPYQIVHPRIESPANAPLTLNTNHVHQPVRLSRSFMIRGEQLGDEDGIRRLARQAAHQVAAAENLVLMHGGQLLVRGQNPLNPPLLDVVEQRGLVSFQERTDGLAEEPPIETSMPGVPGHLTTPGMSLLPLRKFPYTHGATALAAVQAGIAELERRAHFGPYAVLMLRHMWVDTTVWNARYNHHASLRALLREGEDVVRIPDPVWSHYPDVRLVLAKGLVVSLGSGAFDLVEFDAPHVSMVGYGTGADAGDLILRVEERFALRATDERASCDIILSMPSLLPDEEQALDAVQQVRSIERLQAMRADERAPTDPRTGHPRAERAPVLDAIDKRIDRLGDRPAGGGN